MTIMTAYPSPPNGTTAPDSLDIFAVLGTELNTCASGLLNFDQYYRGTQPLSFLHPQIRAEVGPRIRNLVINWPRIAVSAVEERLDVTGFTSGPDKPSDDKLWAIWQHNGMDEASQLAHTEAMALGRAYVTVWADDGGVPTISVESPLQMICGYEPGTRTVKAALKAWRDGNRLYATLYEPHSITKLQSLAKSPNGTTVMDWRRSSWTLRDGGIMANPMGIVPVIPLINDPRLLDMEGQSELANIIPLADAVNKLATDMMVSAEYHAMPRRWAIGMEPPVDPNTNEPLTSFEQLAGRVWLNPNDSGQFGQFPEAELSNFINAINMLTAQIGAIAKLPPHYVGLTTDNPASADAIRASEAALVRKVQRKQRQWGGVWEAVMRMAVLAQTGHHLKDGALIETAWADAETPTVAQSADARQKDMLIGVPWRQLMIDRGASPQQIEDFIKWRKEDDARAAALAPTAPPAAAPPAPAAQPAA